MSALFFSGAPARACRIVLAVLATFTLAACDDDDYDDDATAPTPTPPAPTATTLTATGDVTARVAEFRALLGEPANGATAGQQPAGRREITWDGAGARPFNNRNDFPADFFNTTARNGVVFSTPGTGFRNDSTLFAELDLSNGAEFRTFSPTQLFAPVGSPVMDVHFRVAGAPTPATVSGFGVVFSDVDRAGSARVEAFDAAGRSLGRFEAPPRSDASGLSFVGFRFPTAIVARVRITSGTAAVAAGVRDQTSGGSADLVTMDNFVFGEPQALPAAP
jgi:hypothetical protein